eukprot:SAG22_NODE_7202_length_763_cov_0.670181_2_plen_117_part_01
MRCGRLRDANKKYMSRVSRRAPIQPPSSTATPTIACAPPATLSNAPTITPPAVGAAADALGVQRAPLGLPVRHRVGRPVEHELAGFGEAVRPRPLLAAVDVVDMRVELVDRDAAVDD